MSLKVAVALSIVRALIVSRPGFVWRGRRLVVLVSEPPGIGVQKFMVFVPSCLPTHGWAGRCWTHAGTTIRGDSREPSPGMKFFGWGRRAGWDRGSRNGSADVIEWPRCAAVAVASSMVGRSDGRQATKFVCAITGRA